MPASAFYSWYCERYKALGCLLAGLTVGPEVDWPFSNVGVFKIVVEAEKVSKITHVPSKTMANLAMHGHAL
eukprot:6241127-Lingulodinium_polyedra.AAC.1